MEGLTEGRIVHFVLDHGRSMNEHRPAMVVKVWGPESGYEDGVVNLNVFTDHTNDFLPNTPGSGGLMWKTSVHYSEEKKTGTWHWIEKA